MTFWTTLESRGAAPALIDGAGVIGYADLAAAADAVAAAVRGRLPAGIARPLVLIELSSTREALIAYLAALRAGWPVIVDTPRDADAPNALAEGFDANLVWRAGTGFVPGSSAPVDLHPDLCLMLSTSGTTGAAKLVRLSHGNVASNAAAIAEYLSITPADRAVTTLPAYYSYGLSVLHSYFHAGASIVLTDQSLVDPGFWPLARAQGVTSLALVPAQFDLLDSIAFDRTHLPTLRYVTQAGGKLDPATACRFARRAADEGWDLVIMYGQTEAGPRISYLPPADAFACHDTIGRAIPGGELWLEDAEGQRIDAAEVAGELVYRGPNVMMGYATTSAELSAPAGPPVLRTGDIALRTDREYLRIVGRNSRFLKLYGLRIGLDEVEQALRSDGWPVRASGSDRGLVLFTTDADRADALRDAAADRWNLPRGSVRTEALDAFPLLSSGKLDYRALRERADDLLEQGAATVHGDLEAVITGILRGRTPDPALSFVEQGADSLAYLNVRLALEERMSAVPDDWDRIPLGELYRRATGPAATPAPTMRVPADALGRVVAMLAVIMMHTTDWPTNGGAYVLLLLSGYSLARFQLAPLMAGAVGSVLRTMLIPLLPIYLVVLSLLSAIGTDPDWHWWVLTGNLVPLPIRPPSLEPYWFICAYVQGMAMLTLPFLIPAVRRVVVASPWRAALILCGIASAAAWAAGVDAIELGIRHRHPLAVIALMATGIVVALAHSRAQKWIATAVLIGFTALLWRDGWPTVLLFLLTIPLAVLWTPLVTLPRQIGRFVLIFANASLYIYVLHVPMISLVVRTIPQSNLGWFVAVTILSVIAAVTVKRVLDAWSRRGWALPGRRAAA